MATKDTKDSPDTREPTEREKLKAQADQALSSGLRYVGQAAFPNVPARDLSPDELDELAERGVLAELDEQGQRVRQSTRKLVGLLLSSGHYVAGRASPVTAEAPAVEAPAKET